MLTADGRLDVATATADIGTGTYTILTQIAADALGLAMEDVTATIGDSSLPTSPTEGGSWGAASADSAIQAVAFAVREKLFSHALKMDNSPLADAELDDVVFAGGGRIALGSDPSRIVTIIEVMRSAGVDRIEAEETTTRANSPRCATRPTPIRRCSPRSKWTNNSASFA